MLGFFLKKHKDSKWYPVGFYSESLRGAELNYPIHDKELLAIIRALEVWRSELIGFQGTDPFTVITDHRPLEYFMTKRLLNQRQANWATTLSNYNCIFTYRPGVENTIADSLSRKFSDMRTLKERQDNERTMTLFKLFNDNKTFSFHNKHNDNSENSKLCVLGAQNDVPPLSGVILVEALLEMNCKDADLEIYRVKANNKEQNWTFLRDYILYKGRLIVSAKKQFEN